MVPEVPRVPRVPEVLLVTATELEAKLLSSSRFPLVVTGIGPVNAAHALTRYLATSPKPSLVIQTGVAGAYVPAGIPVGSVVLADTEIYGDLGVMTVGGWRPIELVGIPVVASRDGQPARFNYFPLDAKLVAHASGIAGVHVTRTGPFLTLSAITGVRTLGDELHGRFGALCESMEGAAAAQVCALNDVPFLEVRGISNLVEDRDRSKWRISEAAEAAQAVALKLAENLA
ncbi:MAG TPA: futalosine hydrolase [Vicinamibacterales bacterium]|nr:futalosine hydrolase [Vicinamibacterales bacterium]